MADPFDDGRERLLTDEQRARVGGWLRASADLLGLRDWRIHASPFPAQSDCLAATHLRHDAEVAWVAVGRDFLAADPDDQRITLTHELLHCHVQPIIRMATELVASELGRRTEAVIETAIDRVQERSIDRLAAGMAFLLPAFSLTDEGVGSDQDGDVAARRTRRPISTHSSARP